MPNQYAVEALRHQELLDSYLTFLATSRSPETVAQHREKLRPLLVGAFNDVPPEEFTRARFVAWMTAKKAAPRGFSKRSIQMVLTCAGMLIKWARGEGIEMPDFLEGQIRPKVQKARLKFLSHDDAKKVLAKCRGRWTELFLGCAFYAGMRRSEVKHARWSDVDLVARTISVHGSKTAKDREVPLADPLYEILMRHRPTNASDEPLVKETLVTYATYGALRRVFALAGVPYQSPHRARAGFLTELLANNVGLVEARDLAGHGSATTTDRYLTSTSDRLRRAIAVFK